MLKSIQNYLTSIACEEYKNYKKIYIVVYDKTKNSSQRTSAIRCHFTNMPLRFNLEFYSDCFLDKVHTPSSKEEFKTVMNHYEINIL